MTDTDVCRSAGAECADRRDHAACCGPDAGLLFPVSASGASLTDDDLPCPVRLRRVADRISGRGLAALTLAEVRAELGRRPAAMPGGLLAAFTLPAAPESASAARGRVRAALLNSGLRELADDAEAIVSEFVANAVRHARSPVGVALITAGGALIIITADASPEPPAMSADQDDAESGRGLMMVDAITGGQWGWSTSTAGKSVWAILALV
jgi:hypothetical protein